MEKNYNLELIRMISFIFVILIHVSNFFCRGFGQVTGAAYIFSVTLDVMARVSVPCFFMISGALLLERNDGVKKGLQRTWRFAIVLLVWSIIYYLFEHYYMGDYYDLTDLLFDPVEAHLWYLYAMIPIYLMLPFFQVMIHAMTEQQEKYFMLLCFCISAFVYIASFFGQDLYYDIPIIGDRVYAVAFFLGYYIRKYAPRTQISAGMHFLIYAVCTFINVVGTVIASYRIHDHYERFMEYGNPVVLMASAAFFGGMVLLKHGSVHLHGRMRSIIDALSSCSFGIYLIHIIFLDFYKKYMGGVRLSPYVHIPLLTIAIFLLSFGCVYLLKKLPLGKKIV